MLISLESEYIDSASTPLINKDMELHKIIIKIKIVTVLLSTKKLIEIFLYAKNKKNPIIKIER
tara:strand:- start:370 stop:558 length:189 start_codon:yes stop_codon:yes gene_type:complete